MPENILEMQAASHQFHPQTTLSGLRNEGTNRTFLQQHPLQGDPPIPYREIILTARIMDEIFAQIYPGSEGSHGKATGPGSVKKAPSSWSFLSDGIITLWQME